MLPGTVVRPPGIDGGDVVAAVRGGEQGQLQVRVVRRGVETAVARATVRLLSVLVPSEADDASAAEDARVTAAGTCTTDASGTCVLRTPGGGDYWVLASGYGLARASSHLTLGREKREAACLASARRPRTGRGRARGGCFAHPSTGSG